MICPKCNKEIPDDSVFCLGCGHKLLDKESTDIEKPKTDNDLTSKKKNIPIIAIVVIIAIAGFGLYVNSTPKAKYQKAEKAFENGNYVSAIKYYTAAGEYKDSADKLAISELANHHAIAVGMMENENYEEALIELKAAEGYGDSDRLIQQCNYIIAEVYMKNGDFESAAKSFKESNGYEDADEKILEIGQTLVTQEKYEDAVTIFNYVKDWSGNPYAQYANGIVNFNRKNYFRAASYFKDAGDVLDAKEQYNAAQYHYATVQLNSKKYIEARAGFEEISGYKDSSEMINVCYLMSAKANMDKGNLNTAKSALEKLPSDCSYNATSVSELLAMLNANSQWVELCGTWTSTGGQMRVTQNGDYGYSNGWYRDFETGDENIDIRCQLHRDGTVTVMASGSIPIYTKYSPIQAGLRTSVQSINITENMSKMGSLAINDLTSITFSPSKINVSYKNFDNTNDVYFTYTYKTNIVYGKKTSSH